MYKLALMQSAGITRFSKQMQINESANVSECNAPILLNKSLIRRAYTKRITEKIIQKVLCKSSLSLAGLQLIILVVEEKNSYCVTRDKFMQFGVYCKNRQE